MGKNNVKVKVRTEKMVRAKECPFKKDKSLVIDYKDVALLRKFLTDRGKIRSRRVSGTSVQAQNELAIAIKNAREMGLLPFTSTAR